LGFAFQEGNTRASSVEGQNFPNDQLKKIASAAKITAGSTTATGFTFISYLGRVNYKFANKYLLGASARIDGSSRFGADNRYGFFPSVSAGWIISDEDFLKAQNKISFLKLRASYGLTGNSEIDNFASRGLYEAISYADQAGIQPISIANPELTWENTVQIDAGLDFGFLNNRISGEIDFYNRNTKDLLLNVPLPATNGFISQLQNVGTMNNKGFEFVLNTQNVTGDFNWQTSFNVSKNINKVTKLNVSPIEGGGRNIGRVAEGEPLGYFYSIKYMGVDPATGDALYAKEGGETTNDPGEAVRQKVGNPNPDFIGGLDNKFSFKGIDLSVLLQGVFGNDLYNTAGYFQSVNADYFDNQTKDQLARWRQPGDVTNVPQPRLYAGNGSAPSSRWVQDGSFVRVRSVTLGYNLPADLINRARLQNVRIYLAAQNLFTFTDYEGYDPEVNTTLAGLSNINLGHDFYTPPQARTITIGVNFGF
jgi:TonB-linked SusC/RagA family outer membrane protein